ncbi:MAG TPA: hypothetical protein VFR40_14695 [Lapillicoccus sp.]|nr:hypothetical protein [Lapillicoccus sp.]
MPTDRGDDTRLTDARLAAEIELLGRVIAIAAEHDSALTAAEVDEALGPADDED